METEEIILVIQARMGSSRLPGKVMADVIGKPLIWHMYQRLKHISLISNIVISTTKNNEDKKLIEFAKSEGIQSFAGDENDIIDRLYQTGKKFKSTILVKINADCPLIDPKLIEKGIKIYLKSPEKPDLVTNSLNDTFPEGMQYGIFNFDTIEELWKTIKDPFWREYFFRYIIEHEEKFKIIGIQNEDDLSELRWTVDYKEDLEFVNKIFNELYEKNPYFSMEEILEIIKKNPKISKINQKYSSKDGINDFYRLKEKNSAKINQNE
jgi:spore coat polysaccharide biosynthesis protein SpsF